MPNDSWFQTGKEGEETAAQKQEEARIERENRLPWKFKVEVGSHKKGTLIDDPQFYCTLHSKQMGPKKWTDFTCIRNVDNCPLCESGLKGVYCLLATIIDHSEYRDKKNKVHKNNKLLVRFTPGAITKLLRVRESLGNKSLAHTCFTFHRDKDTECATGEDIKFYKKIPPEMIPKMAPKELQTKGGQELADWCKPYDYVKYFQPKSQEELARIAGIGMAIGGGGGGMSNTNQNSMFTQPTSDPTPIPVIGGSDTNEEAVPVGDTASDDAELNSLIAGVIDDERVYG